MSDSDNPGPQTVAEVQRHSEDAPGQTKEDKELEYMWKRAVIAYKEVTEKDLETLPLPTTDEIKKNISETNKEDEENVKSAVSKKILEGLLQLGEIAADAASEIYPPVKICFNAVQFLCSFVENYKNSFSTEDLCNLLDEIGAAFLVTFQEYAENPPPPLPAVRIAAALKSALKEMMLYFLEICTQCAELAKARKSKGFRAKMRRLRRSTVNALAGDAAVESKRKKIEDVQKKIQGLITTGTHFTVLRMNQKVDGLDGKMDMVQEGVNTLVEYHLQSSNAAKIKEKLPFDESNPSWDSWNTTLIDLKRSVCIGFGNWIRDELSKWADVTSNKAHPTFALKAREGTGQSYLSLRAIDYLTNRACQIDQESSVNMAWIYFNRPPEILENIGMDKSIIPVHDALAALVWQLAQRDIAYQNFVCAQCKAVTGNFDTKEIWDKLFMEYSAPLQPTEKGPPRPDKVFFLVLDGLDLVGDSDADQECRTILKKMIRDVSKLRQTSSNQVRLFLTGSSEFFEALGDGVAAHMEMLDLCDRNNTAVQENIVKDLEAFVSRRMEQVFLENPSYREAQGAEGRPGRGKQDLKDQFQAKLLKNPTGNYLDLNSFFEELRYTPNDELESLLQRDPLFGPKQQIERKLKKLRKDLSDEETEDLNEILAWVVLSSGGWPTLKQLEAVLRLKHGPISSAAGDHIVSRYQILLSRDGDMVCSSAVREYFLDLHKQQRTTRFSARPEAQGPNGGQTPHPKEIAVVKDILKSFRGGELYTRFGFERFFHERLSARPPEINVGHVDGHMRIIFCLLRGFCPEHREDSVVLHDYAVRHLLWHLRQVNSASLARAESQMKMEIGRWLYAFFMHRKLVRAWFTHDRLHVIFSEWWESLDEVLRWFQDPGVGEGAREVAGKKEAMIVLERKDLLLEASRTLASEWLLKSEWNAADTLRWILRLPIELLGGYFPAKSKDTLRLRPGNDGPVSLETIVQAEKWAAALLETQPECTKSTFRVVDTMVAFRHREKVTEICNQILNGDKESWKARWYIAQTLEDPKALENFKILVERFLSDQDLRTREPLAWKNIWSSYFDLLERTSNFDAVVAFCRDSVLDSAVNDYQLLEGALHRMKEKYDKEKEKKAFSNMEEFLSNLSRVTDVDGNYNLLSGLLYRNAQSERLHQVVTFALRNDSSTMFAAYCDARRMAKSDMVTLAYLRYYHALALYHDRKRSGDTRPQDSQVPEEKSDVQESQSTRTEEANESVANAGSSDRGPVQRAQWIWNKNIKQWEKMVGHEKDQLIDLIWDKTVRGISSAYVQLIKSKTGDLKKHVNKLERLRKDQNEAINGSDYRTAIQVARACQLAGQHDAAKNSIKPFVQLAFRLLQDSSPCNDWIGYKLLAEMVAPVSDDNRDASAAWYLAMRSSSPKRSDTADKSVSAKETPARSHDEYDDSDTESDDNGIDSSSHSRSFGIRFRCSGHCGRRWRGRIEDDMWVCKDCADVQFDAGCLERLRKGELERRICNPDHEFILVPKWDHNVENSLGENNVKVGDEIVSVGEWKGKLQKLYLSD